MNKEQPTATPGPHMVPKPLDPEAPWGDEVNAMLDGLDAAPVREHPDVVDAVHAALAARLADTED